VGEDGGHGNHVYTLREYVCLIHMLYIYIWVLVALLGGRGRAGAGRWEKTGKNLAPYD